VLSLRFAAGAVGSVAITWQPPSLPPTHGLSVVATEGTFDLELDPAFVLRGFSRGRPVMTGGPEDPFAQSLQCFLAAVRTGSPEEVYCTPRQAAGTLAVALATERSLASGLPVRVTTTEEARWLRS
jgi:hypothetical protein